MYPQKNQQNVSFEISTKCLQSNKHESKSIPDGRVTKLITQADTLQKEILTLQEDSCRNQRSRSGNDLNKTIQVRTRDLAMTI